MKNEESGESDILGSGEDRTAAKSLSLGDSAYVDEDYEEALTNYTAASITSTKSTAPIVRFRIHSHRAAALTVLKRYTEAAEDTGTALDMIPVPQLPSSEIEVCWRRQGIAYFYTQAYVKAASSFGKALQLATLNRKGQSFDYKGWIQKCQKVQTPTAQASEVPKKTKTDVKEETMATPPTATILPKPVASPSAPVTTTPAPIEKPKYQYYQNDTTMTICVLEPNVQASDLQVDFSDQNISVKLNKRGQDFTVLGGMLYEDADNCRVNIRQEKVLIKLRKTKQGVEWHDLLDKKKRKTSTTTPTNDTLAADAPATAAETDAPTATPPDPTKSGAPTVRPYASHKDWNSLERQLKEEEEQEKPEGDEAMNKLFRQIYAGADEDTRRAMIKSYQTSGGTCLSTNWDEVKKKDYEKERTAPKGMEWKTYEGDKLPMKEDD